MQLGIEGARGLAEKIQPIVRFPILMRVVLPGALATVISYSFTGLRTDLLFAELKDVWRELILVVVMPFIFGAVISALSGEMYKLYEGRTLWPQKVFDFIRTRQESRVEKLLSAAKKAKEAKRELQYDEIWHRLRMYPMSQEGEPYASHPTLLGNILAGYEDYPSSRYGMDSVFYWPRLWLELDKEKKEEIDGGWSIADGFLSLSAVSFLGGMLWILAAVMRALSVPLPYLPLSTCLGTAFGGAVLLVSGYVMYRASLPFHRRNGETFKAVFDLYRNKITAMTSFGPAEVTKWQGTWSYLQYLYVHCTKCSKYFPANQECCKCGYPSAKSLEELGQITGGPSRQTLPQSREFGD
jgi:hypothetical protein